MNFTPELLAFQGAISSADNAISFSKITARGGNEDEIIDCVGRLFRFLKEKGYINEHGVTAEGQGQMRIYCFYLILNCDIAILEDMVVMPGIDHAVWTTPTINKHLICEFIWGLSMEHYLSEILVFCNPSLSVQLLMLFLDYIKYSTPVRSLNQLRILCLSSYKLICRLHFYDYESSFIATILSDIFDNFLRCLTYYLSPPNAEKLNTLTEDELYKYKGHKLQNVLSLTHECLGHFISPVKFEVEGFDDLYLCTIKPHHIKTRYIPEKICESNNNLLMEYIHKMNTALLDRCQVLVMATSVEIFCAWSEFEENGRSMQQTVGEMCYFLHSRAEKIPTLVDHPLINMLLALSRKPTDIHDVIKSSDNEIVVENANKATSDQVLWLQAIMDKEDLKDNEALLECLLNNIAVLQEHHCEKLFKLLTGFLNEAMTLQETHVKMLAIKAFSKLNMTTKAAIVMDHFSGKVFHNSLQCEQFHSMTTELFNKLIESPATSTNFSDIYNIFIQNPAEVYMKIICMAVDNGQLNDLMMRIMIMLEPFVNHYYESEMDCALVKAIEKVSHVNLESDVQLNNFVGFVTELKKNGSVTSAKLMMLIIMPGLYKALLTRDIQLITVEVKLLKNAYEMCELLSYRAPLLAMISQIIETVRWSFSSFTTDAPATLAETLELQMKLFNTYQLEMPIREVDWLKRKLRKVHPLNMYYYKSLWKPPGTNFLENISGQQKQMLNADKTTILLARILGLLTPREWALAWNCIRSHGDITAFQILYNAMILIITTVTANRNVNTWACLLYCYRNFVTIIKDQLLYEPLANNYVESVIGRMITMINRSKDEDMEDIGNIMLPLFSYIAERKGDYTTDLSCVGNRIRHGNFAEIINRLFANNH